MSLQQRRPTMMAGLFVLVVGSWELGIRLSDVPAYVLPAPSRVFVALYRGLSGGGYLVHIGTTLTETILGFALGAVVGFGLGALVAMSRFAEVFLDPYIVMFQSLPKVALAPLIMIWFGLGLTSKVVTTSLVAFFPVFVNTRVGLRAVDDERLALLEVLHATRWQTFWMLRLPTALPYLMAGLDVALSFGLVGAVVSEFMGAQRGLGMLMQSMSFSMDVSGQFSVLLVLALLGLCLQSLLSAARRRILFWEAPHTAGKAQ